MIKKYYFINKFDTNNIDKQDKQTAIIYRNYLTKTPDQTLILKIKKYCKKKSIKFYLSNNIKLAIKLDLDGAYIPSFNKSLKHLSYSYKKNLHLIFLKLFQFALQDRTFLLLFSKHPGILHARSVIKYLEN